MRLPALVFACLSAMALSGSVGQANAASPDVETIRQREQHRVRLLTARDYDALEKMTSPTLSYSHSAGAIDTRASWFANLRSGQVVFSKLQHRDPAVRFLAPDVAILNSLADVEVSVGGTLQKMVLRLTIVYVRKDGEWLFEAWHSSRLPD
jgi:hypothetical protein